MSGLASMRILLVQPPIEDFYTTAIRLYPLGLLYAAAVLERAGVEVGILDCLNPLRRRTVPVPKSFSHLPAAGTRPHFFKGYYRFGLDDDEIARRVHEFAPDAVGISSQFTAYYESVEKLARLIKQDFPRPVFIGGHHATAFAEKIRRRTPEIDFVLEGTAEASLPGWLKELGLMPTEPTGSMLNPPSTAADWRSLRPSHHLLGGADYKIGKRNAVSMIAGRGCPYSCDFCNVQAMFGRKMEYREAAAILDEMRWNYQMKDVKVFNFEDDNLSYDRDWFLNFLAEVSSDPILKGIELTAMNGLCFQDLDGERLRAMRSAGFRRLNLSLVTQSGELRNHFGRPAPFREIEPVIRSAQQEGFLITAYVIIGLPGQSYDEAKAGIDKLLSLGVLVGPSVFYLVPGSRLYERMSVPPGIKNDWNLYRSSAFAVETDELSRRELLDLFLYARRKNLERLPGKIKNGDG